MKYNFQKELIRIWEKAVKLYKDGNRDPSSFPITEEIPFLHSIGMSLVEVFDFAEDWVCEGEPDFATFLLIHEQRRDYFWEAQKKIPSSKKLDPSTLPKKTDSVHGIVWLPRIIPKARAKLKGELSDCTMFCCGGDRNFFRRFDIHPVEFLRVVKRSKEEDQIIIDWVLSRKKESSLFVSLQ